MIDDGIRARKVIVDLWQRAGMLVVFLALFSTAAIFVDGFLSWRNMLNLTLSVSMIGMVACTMLFCLASGDFDLSVESVVACSGVVAAVVIVKIGDVPPSVFKETLVRYRVPLGMLCGVLAGGVVGLFNGVVIAKLKINALIATLATMQIVRGLGFIFAEGSAVGVPQESFAILGENLRGVLEYCGATGVPDIRVLDIPAPTLITIACFVVFGLLLNKTTYGRNTLAIGGNREAARLAGIAVDRIKITIFTVQGLMAGLAGVVMASRMTSGQPKSSEGFSLDVISSCVLGGVALSGGIGTITGTIVGVLILGTVRNAMDMAGVHKFYQYVVTGGILLIAVLLDQLKRKLART